MCVFKSLHSGNAAPLCGSQTPLLRCVRCLFIHAQQETGHRQRKLLNFTRKDLCFGAFFGAGLTELATQTHRSIYYLPLFTPSTGRRAVYGLTRTFPLTMLVQHGGGDRKSDGDRLIDQLAEIEAAGLPSVSPGS